MRALRLILAGCLTAAVTAIAPGEAAATAWDDETVFTFTAPVVVPEETLPAGTYVFKLDDSFPNRSTVQIWNEEETELVTTALTIPTANLEPVGDVLVTFATTPEGTPPAVHSWFPAGQASGHEFVYPTEQARSIAETTKTLVLSSDFDADDPESWKVATLTRFDEFGGQHALDSPGASSESAQRDREYGRSAENADTDGIEQDAANEPAATAADVGRETTSMDDSAGGAEPASGAERATATTRGRVGADRDAGPSDDYRLEPPDVAAAPSDREQASGRVMLHGLEGEDLAEHHVKHARRLADEMVTDESTGDLDRTTLEDIREHVEKAYQALNGASS